ncbi:MAG TPA: hypothetical protein VIP11_18880 [Gemmatimonadaceae bacterium]
MIAGRASAVLLLGLTLAGCASGGGTPSVPPPSTRTVLLGAGATGGLSITGVDATNSQTIAFPVDQVFRIMPSVLDSLGVPVAMLEPTKRSIGNPALKIRQRLKGTPLSRYIDCGSSTQIGANADNYDVSLAVIADVAPGAANSSNVTLTFEAVAKPVNFSQQYSQCTSRGLFESRFFQILKAKLQR